MQVVQVLSPRPPVRAFAIAAGAATLGAALILWGNSAGAAGLSIGGWIGLLAGCVLALVATLAWRRMRVTVTLDDTGYLIAGPETDQRGAWLEVTKVTQGPSSLIIHQGPEHRVRLLDPSGSGRGLISLGAEIGQFLDRSRGYRN